MSKPTNLDTGQEHIQLDTKLCSLQKKCLHCQGTGNIEEKAYLAGVAVTTCSECHGTGLVYVLDDSVRVLCNKNYHEPGRYYDHVLSVQHRVLCPGFTPSTDLAVWIEAIFKAWPGAVIRITNHDITLLIKMPNSSKAAWSSKGSDLFALQSVLTRTMREEQDAT